MPRAPRTHCPNGHPYTPENVRIVRATGWRKCRMCRRAALARYIERHPERWAHSQEAWRAGWRLEVRVLYGSKCGHCGFTDPRALQLDHIHGGGVKENKALGTRGIYQRALKYPDEYQLLCANCNWIKRVENKEYRRKKPHANKGS